MSIEQDKKEREEREKNLDKFYLTYHEYEKIKHGYFLKIQ
jgi:hypothetical protein